MHSTLRDEITDPFPNFNDAIVEVWERKCNFIWHFIYIYYAQHMHVCSYLPHFKWMLHIHLKYWLPGPLLLKYINSDNGMDKQS